MSARIASGRQDMPPERCTLGKGLLSATSKVRCPTKTPSWYCTAAEDTGRHSPPTHYRRWGIATRFRWMAGGGLIKRPTFRWSGRSGQNHLRAHINYHCENYDLQGFYETGKALVHEFKAEQHGEAKTYGHQPEWHAA